MPFSKPKFENRSFDKANSIEILIESCDCSSVKILKKFKKVRSEESSAVRMVSSLMSVFGFFLVL